MGLGFLFDGWQTPNVSVLYEQGGLAAVEKYYNTRAARFGVPATIPSQLLGSIAIQVYRQKRVSEAEQLVLRAIEVNPNDTNAHLIAGRLYFDQGNKAKAVEHLTKALLLGPTRRSVGVDYAALNLDPQKVVPAVEVSTKDLQKCVGAYGSSVPALEIVRRGTRLFALIDNGEQELTALSETRFYFTRGDEVVTFRRGDRGRIVGVALQNRGLELARSK
jgi:tetratricopeptide (TPR) repeat protein